MKRTVAFALLILAASVLVWADGNFRIEHPTITEGSARSSSTSFVLQGCVSIGPGGTSSSDSFQMQTGCAAVFLNKDTGAQKPNQGEAGKVGNNAPNGKAGQTEPPITPHPNP